MASSAISSASASVSPSVTTSGRAGTVTVKPPSSCGSRTTVKSNFCDTTVSTAFTREHSSLRSERKSHLDAVGAVGGGAAVQGGALAGGEDKEGQDQTN